MDINQTHCSNHFALCTYIRSLCYTLKTNTMFYANYINKNYVFYIPLAENKIFEIVIHIKSTPARIFSPVAHISGDSYVNYQGSFECKILAGFSNMYY